jgi:hypothetical protein
MGNSESRNKLSEQNEVIENKPHQNQWHDAVNGNTEQLQVSSPKPPVNHAVFETTSENENFTVTENLKPAPVSTPIHENVKLTGGIDLSFIYNKLSNLVQDTEMDGGLSDNILMNNHLSKIKELLQDSETEAQLGGNSSFNNDHFDKIKELLQETESNNLVGGGSNVIDINPMINKLRDLLLQETENNIINFKGGNLNNENLFSENKLTESEKSDHNKEELVEKKESPMPNENKELPMSNENKELPDEEDLKTDQSGGEELDTELKKILVELQSNKDNKHVGGKSSRKGSKKSSKKSGSKKQSRRSSEASEASNNTYNITDSDESDAEDYLSTSSMNTSDINIKHYRS